MKKLRAVIALTGVATLLALGLGACGDSSGDSDAGRVLRGTYAAFPDSLDPALAFSSEGWTVLRNSYIPLLTYAHASGRAAARLIPGLAESLPRISDGGRTYALRLRPGLRYSDGSPVRASDFTRAVERAFELNSPGAPFYTGIVGAERFAKTKEGGIAGIETDDRSGRIVIHLVEPSGTFANELALMFVAPVPPGTPAEDLTASPPPATGPYVITNSKPGRSFEIERNPQWAKANSEAMPDLPGGDVDKFQITVIKNLSTQVNGVEQGKIDWMGSPPPPSRLGEVRRKYEGSQFREEQTISTFYFWMNTQRPPFDDLRVRRAVNYAVDPAALERIYAGTMRATQQILPPGMPGYEKFAPYPHDPAKARELIARADPADRDIAVWTNDFPQNTAAGEYYEDVLSKLGFKVTLKVIGGANYFATIGNLSTPELDTGWSNWIESYPHPNDFFGSQISGESITSTGNTNWAQIDDPELNATIKRLGREQLGPKQEAEYAALDRATMEQAPWAPFGTLTASIFVSSAIDLDEVVYSPIFGPDLTSFQFK